jgi:hypothetical protein
LKIRQNSSQREESYLRGRALNLLPFSSLSAPLRCPLRSLFPVAFGDSLVFKTTTSLRTSPTKGLSHSVSRCSTSPGRMRDFFAKVNTKIQTFLQVHDNKEQFRRLLCIFYLTTFANSGHMAFSLNSRSRQIGI